MPQRRLLYPRESRVDQRACEIAVVICALLWGGHQSNGTPSAARAIGSREVFGPLTRTFTRRFHALKEMLAAEVSAVLAKEPNLKIVKVADGASDYLNFLSSSALPAGEEALDFFHASEHLHAAVAAAYGDGTHETRFRYDTLRDALRDQRGGADTVIRALKHLVAKHPQKTEEVDRRGARVLPKEPPAHALPRAQGAGPHDRLRRCRGRVQDDGRPATQAVKQSGMRWSSAGAQAVLTPRGWDQSDRFDEAWALIAASFQSEVTVLANVIALKPKPPERAKKKPPQAASR